MFSRLTPLPVTWFIGKNLATTQLASDKTVIVWRAPFRAQVVDPGFAAADTAIAKSTTNFAIVNVYNAGTAGTGTSVIATATIGKTATVAASVPTALALSSTVAWQKLDALDYVSVKYDENGTLVLFNVNGAFGVMYGHDA